MTHPTPYIHFPGTAREALTFYGDVFGCAVQVHTYADFGRIDGPPEAVAHGMLLDGPVALFGADAGPGEQPLKSEGLMLSLLGAAAPDVAHEWFARLCRRWPGGLGPPERAGGEPPTARSSTATGCTGCSATSPMRLTRDESLTRTSAKTGRVAP